MKRLLVLGAGTAGTAGTMVVNKLRHRLDPEEWAITVVDQDTGHYADALAGFARGEGLKTQVLPGG